MNNKNLQWYELPKERWQTDPKRRSYRDSQRQKLYDAESYTRYKLNDKKDRFESIEEIQKFVNKLIFSTWFIKRFGNKIKCEVRAARSNQKDAYTRMEFISLPKWAWTKMIVLHELTHILTRYYEGGHGRFFARTLLEIIRHVLGYKAGLVLKKYYRMYNVKHMPNKNISTEARKALSDRFKLNVLKQKITI